MKKTIISIIPWVLPVVALAQTQSGVFRVIQLLQNIINAVIPLIIAAALLFFLWSLAMYLFSSEKKDLYKTLLLEGLLVLFVMVSVWGLVNLLGETLFGGGRQITPGVLPRVQ